MEPGNRQAQELEKAIEKSMNSGKLVVTPINKFLVMSNRLIYLQNCLCTDAVKGAAIAGGGILVAGGLVALGMALLKK